MNLFKHLVFAKNFAFDAKRVGVFLVFYALALLVLGALALSFLTAIGVSLGSLTGFLTQSFLFDGQRFFKFAGFGLFFLFAFVILALVFFLAFLWLFAGVTRNAAHLLRGNRVSLSACLSEGLARLPALVVLTILVGLSSWIASLIAQFVLMFLLVVPIVGPVVYVVLIFLVSIVISLAFLFAQFFLLVRDAGVFESMRESVRLFARKPGSVLVAFLSYLVVLLAVIIVALLPLVATFLLAVASLATLASKIVLFAVLGVISIAFLLLGFSFTVVFNAGFFSSVLFELSTERVERVTRIKGKRLIAGKKKR